MPATLHVMNDEINLYFAIEFAHTTAGNTASFTFDNDHDAGALENGDDAVILSPSLGFRDLVRTNEPPCTSTAPGACGLFDTDFGGTNELLLLLATFKILKN